MNRIGMAENTPAPEPIATEVSTSDLRMMTIKEWRNGIWFAALVGNRDGIAKMIQRAIKPLALVKSRDNADYTALHYAAANGYTDVCRLLLEKGANIDAPTKITHITPLHKACASGYIDTVKFLVRSGACLEMQDIDGQTALHKAAEFRRITVIHILLKACPQLARIRDINGCTAGDCFPIYRMDE